MMMSFNQPHHFKYLLPMSQHIHWVSVVQKRCGHGIGTATTTQCMVSRMHDQCQANTAHQEVWAMLPPFT